MFGTLIFSGAEKDLEHVSYIIDSDDAFLMMNIAEIEGPYVYNIGDDSILYKVRFNDDQWINIVEMTETLEQNKIDVEIIHAVSDNQFVDVVSTSSYYDNFADDAAGIKMLFEQFGFDITEDVLIEDDD